MTDLDARGELVGLRRAPLRAVRSAEMLSGRGSVLGPDTSRRARWWVLDLECGHRVERGVRYRQQLHTRRGQAGARLASDVLPAPARARCGSC